MTCSGIDYVPASYHELIEQLRRETEARNAAQQRVKEALVAKNMTAVEWHGERERLLEGQRQLGDLIERNIVAMQAAWIEWQHGDGAEAAMKWIHNTLAGPGFIPDGTDAQKHFDDAVAPIDARTLERLSKYMKERERGTVSTE